MLSSQSRQSAISLFALLVRFCLAHGGGDDVVGTNDTVIPIDKGRTPHQSYFALADHGGLIYAHLVLMSIAWVLILPIVVMLSLARSRLTLVSRFCFLTVNALGLVLGIVYQVQTPDLYPNSAHGKVGWIITGIVSAQALVSLSTGARKADGESSPASLSETLALMPPSAESVRLRRRLSDDSGQGIEPGTASLRSHPLSSLDDGSEDNFTPTSRTAMSTLDKEYGLDNIEDETVVGTLLFTGSSTSTPTGAARSVSTRAKITSTIMKYLDVTFRIIDRLILLLGFVALTTGLATFGRLFEGHGIFSGLAHWIKGGVFFWLGLFTLGRWTGSFAEFVESCLIFFYGSTNIFLEHLGKWGMAWSAQDLEHTAITVLFIGGGLCGMLIESVKIRRLLNTATLSSAADTMPHDEERQRHEPPATYELSLNPIPALVILLLGIMMSSHHQSAMISTMVHKQWGNLLLGASLARGLTYVLMFLRPPTSIFPSRPPTELLASFGLIAGGVLFMASSSDTIAGMINYKLDAMFVFTATAGLVGILMAWEIFVLAVKGWAIRQERCGSHDAP